MADSLAMHANFVLLWIESHLPHKSCTADYMYMNLLSMTFLPKGLKGEFDWLLNRKNIIKNVKYGQSKILSFVSNIIEEPSLSVYLLFTLYRNQAVMIGQGLLESGWLEPVPNTRDGGAVFKDEYVLYQPGVVRNYWAVTEKSIPAP